MVKQELQNWKNRAQLAVREDNEHKQAAETAASAAAAKLGEAELNKAAVAAEKNGARKTQTFRMFTATATP